MSNPAEEKKRGTRRTVTGEVVSNKASKTIVVRSVRSVKHPRYGKFIKKSSKYHAHDENETASIGDVVEIHETRPLSATKRWRLGRVVRSQSGASGGDA